MPVSQIVHQLQLGDLAAKLSKFPSDLVVRLDASGDYPDDLMSYRGFYDQLSIGYGPKPKWTVGDMVKRLRDAVGKEFTGYKGGEFLMDELTPIWISNYGECDRRAVVDVIQLDDVVVIRTVDVID